MVEKVGPRFWVRSALGRREGTGDCRLRGGGASAMLALVPLGLLRHGDRGCGTWVDETVFRRQSVSCQLSARMGSLRLGLSEVHAEEIVVSGEQRASLMDPFANWERRQDCCGYIRCIGSGVVEGTGRE